MNGKLIKVIFKIKSVSFDDADYMGMINNSEWELC